jgi:hypothetical protein
MADTPKQKLKATQSAAKKAVDKIMAAVTVDMYERKPTRETSGKTNITPYQSKAGIYFIIEQTIINGKIKGEEVVYVGMSSYDLYKTVTRHFQTWNDRDQRNRISYKSRIAKGTHNYQVGILQTSPTTAKLAEKELILLFAPRDNKEKLAFFEQASDLQVLEMFLKELARLLGNRRSKIINILSNAKKYGSKMPTAKRKMLQQEVKLLSDSIKATGYTRI